MSDIKEGQPQAIKIGFAIGGVKKRKDATDVHKEEQREYVTSISGNKVISLNPKKEDGPLVIPLVMNNEAYLRWKKKQKSQAEVDSQTTSPMQQTSPASDIANQPSPLQDQTSAPTETPAENGEATNSLHAEEGPSQSQEAHSEAPKEKNFGLIMMKPRSNGRAEENKDSDDDVKNEDIPLVWRNRVVGLEDIEDPDEKFRFDVQSRPDEADAAAYESVPVEDFGTALLRGMGWAPGKPIGLNNRGLVEPIEYVRRGFRQGLGADLKPEEVKPKKHIKPGESRAPKPHMVLPEDASGRRRNVRKLSEKLVPYQPPSAGFVANALVGIVTGPHDGLYGRITAVSGDKVQVRLEASSEVVVCTKDELCILDKNKLAKGHPLLAKQNQSDQQDDEDGSSDDSVDRMDVDKREDKSDDRRSSKSDREKHRHDKDRHKEKEKEKHKHKHKSDRKEDKHKQRSDKDRDSSHKNDRKEDKTPLWVMPNIVVKVVSKSFHNGKYYSKKVQVVDVASKNKFSAVLDDGKLVDGFSQDHVQTYVPQPPSLVMIVEGPNRGRIGKLLERDDRADKVVVQLTEDFSVVSLSLDSVSQYTGTQDDD